MNEQELERLAARLVSGPREPGLYGRTLEAAAVARRGLELLQELAEKIEGTPGPPRPLTDPGQVNRLRPGDRLARHPDPDSAEAATDLLDEAAGQLGFVLASGSIRDLTRNLDRLTDEGLREQMTAALIALLKTLPPGDLEHLRQVINQWPGEPRPPWPHRRTTDASTDAEHLAAIRELAAESGRFFAGQDISPEAAAALVLFQQVASWPVPTVIAFRKIERLLRQAALS